MHDDKLRLPLIVRKSLEFFCKQTRIGVIPTRKADPNILLIALKQDYIQNVQKPNNCKGVYVTRRDADQIS